MSSGVFFEIARNGRRRALLSLSTRDLIRDPFQGRNRPPRVTRATISRLMGR